MAFCNASNMSANFYSVAARSAVSFFLIAVASARSFSPVAMLPESVFISRSLLLVSVHQSVYSWKDLSSVSPFFVILAAREFSSSTVLIQDLYLHLVWHSSKRGGVAMGDSALCGDETPFAESQS